jgi:hypothetical protein
MIQWNSTILNFPADVKDQNLVIHLKIAKIKIDQNVFQIS